MLLGSSPEPSPSNVVPQPEKHTRDPRIKPAILTAIIFLVVLAAGVTLFYYSNPPVNPSVRSTFQEYGITIQYPTRSTEEINGAEGPQANSASGDVKWLWNGGSTYLLLSWTNTNASQYNYSEAFQTIVKEIQADKNFTDVSVVSTGNISMAGTNWPYETFQLNYQGTTNYVTYSFTFYQGEGRVYLLGFGDTSPDTISNLQNFGATFHG